MKKCIVMIPASSSSKHFIPAIFERGYQPIIVDPFFEDQQSDYRDNFMSDNSFFDPYNPIYLANKRDINELVEELKQYDIEAIIAGSDVGAELTDQLNTMMGLRGNSSETTYRRHDKLAQQESLKEAGIRYIKSKEISSLEEAIAFYKELGKESVVVKPISGGGSEGVHICNSEEDLIRHVNTELNKINVYGTKNVTLLLQECIKGKEYVVNTVSKDGKHVLTDMWFYEKIKLDGERNVYDYMKLIVDIEPGDRELVKYTFAVLDAVDYQYGPCHTELMVDENGPVLIEVNPRISGGDMPKELGLECLGYTTIDCVLDAYLDEEAFDERGRSFYHPKKHAMYKMLISPKSGKADEIPAVQLFDVLPSVRMKNFGGVLKKREVARTIDVLTSPANAWLVHEDERVLMRDHKIIHYMESNCFELLFEEAGSISEKEKAELDQALLNMKEVLHMIPEAIYIVDKEQIAGYPEGVPVYALEDVTEEKLPASIKNVIYHAGTRMENLEALYQKLSILNERLESGGCIMVSPWGASSVPYGEHGIECVLMAMGLVVEIPKHTAMKLMQKAVIARKK